MSEYTIIYLRKKQELLKYSDDNEHNKKVDETLGCRMFYLTTTPSRELQVLPWTNQPKILSLELIQDCIQYYLERIKEINSIKGDKKNKIKILEERLQYVTSIEIYKHISNEIDELLVDNYYDEELEELNDHKNQFEFLFNIINDRNKEYELIYIKC